MKNEQIEKHTIPLLDALRRIEEAVRPINGIWLVGGSTGLLLQGVPLSAGPRDLDLYADRSTVLKLHASLQEQSIDAQEENATPIYHSILSHYDIQGIKVELVGAFKVMALGCDYQVEVEEVLSASAVPYPIGGGRLVRLMPLVHELVFNMLRERPDRYEAIAGVCRSTELEAHQALYERLTSRNRFSEEIDRRIRRLLNF